ncbi:hypothetical protein E4V16_13690, partial [Proteus mirabilis]
ATLSSALQNGHTPPHSVPIPAPHTAIQLGKDFVGQDVHSEAINSDDEATLRYMAQYYATGKAIVGDVISSVHYTIAYE